MGILLECGSKKCVCEIHRQMCITMYIIQRIMQNLVWNKSTDESSHLHDILPSCSLYPNLYSRAKKKKKSWITLNTVPTCLCPSAATSNPLPHTLHVWEFIALICTSLTFNRSIVDILTKKTNPKQDIWNKNGRHFDNKKVNQWSKKLACHVGTFFHLQGKMGRMREIKSTRGGGK